MARFSGNIGFAVEEDNGMGGFTESITTKKFRGWVKYDTVRQTDVSSLIPVTTSATIIEVLANRYLFENYFNIRWVEYQGVKWEVKGFTFPNNRISMTLGGRYRDA